MKKMEHLSASGANQEEDAKVRRDFEETKRRIQELNSSSEGDETRRRIIGKIKRYRP